MFLCTLASHDPSAPLSLNTESACFSSKTSLWTRLGPPFALSAFGKVGRLSATSMLPDQFLLVSCDCSDHELANTVAFNRQAS